MLVDPFNQIKERELAVRKKKMTCGQLRMRTACSVYRMETTRTYTLTDRRMTNKNNVVQLSLRKKNEKPGCETLLMVK